MKYNTIPQTELSVSEICLGTMTWGQQNTEDDAHAQLDYATSHGVNFIDTAEGYPVPRDIDKQGRTETYIGNWLKKRGRRDDLVIASKVAGPSMSISDRPIPTKLDAKNISAAIDSSLRRLQTDHLDLYQVHWPERSSNFLVCVGYSPWMKSRQRRLRKH